MQRAVSITLIVAGTCLLVTPYLFNAIHMHQVTSTMIQLSKDVNLTGDLPRWADETVYLSGVIMIAVGAVAGLRPEHAHQSKSNE